MHVTVGEIMDLGGQTLPFSRDLREAIGLYARRRWPLNTSVHAAQAWGLPKATAKNVLKGHASDATVTKIMRAGGWELALPVIGAVVGAPVHEFFRDQMREAAKAAEHARQHDALAEAAYRRLASDAAPPGEDRRTWKSPGKMGAEATAGLARRRA